MAEYIKREALITKFKKMELGEHGLVERLFADGVYAVIAAFPAAEVVPVVHGRWIHDGRRIKGGIDWCHCSECGKSDNFCARTNYCPNCGAKMDGGVDDEADGNV